MAKLSLQVREALKRQVPRVAKKDLNREVRKAFRATKKKMIKEWRGGRSEGAGLGFVVWGRVRCLEIFFASS